MYKIALIGAGQLGSRHLQALAKSNIDISIEVVEPFEKSREVAKQRFKEIPYNENIKALDFFSSIDELSEVLDIVIVATNADVRSRVIKELFVKKKVNNIVLEKVLFQTVEEYVEVEKILKKTLAKCWVNHPRRMFPFYKNLQKEMKGSVQICYTVHGGAWGLGCNALHFIDHLSFLSGESELKIDYGLLHQQIYEAKRVGFVEFNGLLRGSVGNHLFTLYSGSEHIPTTMMIASERLSVFIDEAGGYVRISRKSNDWQWEESHQKIIYFQSEMSNIFIEQILTTGVCDLPTYDEAMKLHIPFIKALLLHMEKVDGHTRSVCPIT